MNLLDNPGAAAWLRQFPPEEVPIAQRLLRVFRLISASDFAAGLALAREV
jgi:hypothetical protein